MNVLVGMFVSLHLSWDQKQLDQFSWSIKFFFLLLFKYPPWYLNLIIVYILAVFFCKYLAAVLCLNKLNEQSRLVRIWQLSLLADDQIMNSEKLSLPLYFWASQNQNDTCRKSINLLVLQPNYTQKYKSQQIWNEKQYQTPNFTAIQILLNEQCAEMLVFLWQWFLFKKFYWLHLLGEKIFLIKLLMKNFGFSSHIYQSLNF